RSPPRLSPHAPWRSRSLMLESGYTRSVSREVLAHAGVPHHAVHACHARRVAWLLRRRSQLWRWEPSCPPAMCTRSSGPAFTCLLHVLPGCTASPPALPRLWQHRRQHTPVASSTVLAPQEERRRARTRCPCAIDG